MKKLILFKILYLLYTKNIFNIKEKQSIIYINIKRFKI